MNGNGLEVGVLALQGASAPHHAVLARLGVMAREVRSPSELEGLTHLILPGGESTTIRHLLELFDLGSLLVERQRRGELKVFGLCAGAILLGRDEGADSAGPAGPLGLGLLDAVLERNAYGRQVHSFSRTEHLDGLGCDFRCIFIRAPRIRSVGPGVRVLGSTAEGEPLLVQAPGILAGTFHPELTGDPLLHRHFLERV